MHKLLISFLLVLGFGVFAGEDDLIEKNRELQQKLEQAKRQAAEIYEQEKALRREKHNTEKTIVVMQQVLKNIKTNQKERK